jgi:hypothetical protein
MIDREIEETTISLSNVLASDWVKLNLSVVGFYRVYYS